MSDQNGPATPTGVPRNDTGASDTNERGAARPAHRPEDNVDVDVKYDDIDPDPVRDPGDDAPPASAQPASSER